MDRNGWDLCTAIMKIQAEKKNAKALIACKGYKDNSDG